MLELQVNQELTYQLLCGLSLFLLGMFFVPFVGYFKKVITKMIHRLDDQSDFHLKSIDHRVLNTPPIALGQARAEIRRMANISLQCLDETLLFLADAGTSRVSELQTKEELLDRLQKEIMVFLAALSVKSISQEASCEISSLMHMVNFIERVGDQCENIWRLEMRKKNKKIFFSKIAVGELNEISSHTRNFLFFVIEKLGEGSSKEFKLEAMKMDASIADLESSLRHNHINRLGTGECAVLPGLIFIDLIHAFKMIGDHTFGLSEIITGKK